MYTSIPTATGERDPTIWSQTQGADRQGGDSVDPWPPDTGDKYWVESVTNQLGGSSEASKSQETTA